MYTIKVLFKTIFRIAFLIVFTLFLFAGVDYYRMTKGKLPVFQVSQYNSQTRKQNFIGTFYHASRIVRANPQEPLEESSKVKYFLFSIPIDLEVEKSVLKESYIITTQKKENCPKDSTLIYADKDIKVYTYCIENITIESNGKKTDLLSYIQDNPSNLEELKGQLAYMGIVSNTKTYQFDTRSDPEYDIRLFECNDLYVPDITIGPKDMNYQENFCSFKDDDFLFIYELRDESPEIIEPVKNEKGENVPEVIYEDEKYRYEFDVPKSQYVFVLVPAIRGRVERKIPLKEVIQTKLLTFEQLEGKGLKFNKIDKEEERKQKEEEEKRKKEEEERKLKEEAEKNNPVVEPQS